MCMKNFPALSRTCKGGQGLFGEMDCVEMSLRGLFFCFFPKIRDDFKDIVHKLAAHIGTARRVKIGQSQRRGGLKG